MVLPDGEQKRPSVLVVGNYCHDVLFRGGEVVAETLGGAASFVSNVLDDLSPSPSHYVSKVGTDFAYAVPHPPLAAAASPTTLFHAYFPSPNHTEDSDCGGYHGDRVLRRVRACDPILPSDLPDPPAYFDFGVAVAVAGEIPHETLERMIDRCSVVFVDVQGLLRSFDPVDGTVGLVSLSSTQYLDLLPRIAFLKASSEEAPFLDIEEARKWCCVIVTEGKEGCRVYWKEGAMHIAPFPAVQIDPTGAGDSFLGGFVGGLLWGLTVPDAALLGNFFGSITVGQVGVPKLDQKMLQNVKQVLEQKTMLRVGSCVDGAPFSFLKSNVHDEFQASLEEAGTFTRNQCPTDQCDNQDNC